MSDLDKNPDVAELQRYNRDACKHERMTSYTRWLGGTPGRIGGQRPVTWWHCDDCKEWVREWDPLVDTEQGRELVRKLKISPPSPNRGEGGPSEPPKEGR